MAKKNEQVVRVEGHTLTLSNLDKVMYPETGTTKGDVIRYYTEVASYLLPYAADRPVTRKRWVNGVGTAEKPGMVFFQKDLDDSTPEWVARQTIHHKDHDNSYPLLNDLATLTWLAQIASLELHVPQWRFTPDGERGNPDRMVLDLDPGEGVGLPECVEVAKLVRGVLSDMGLEAVPVTSGSKGIHLYAPLDGTSTSEQVSEVAHELARSLEADHPNLVISTMRKADRRGKVMVDWSQNNAAKTTVTPYSLRGRSRPFVAMPRTWREITSGRLRQIEFHEVMGIIKRRGDAAEPLLPKGAGGSGAAVGAAAADRLATYRSMRSADRTPEPVPEEAPRPGSGRTFVIQKHQARRLHYDFRLERDGVLVSWALPKGVPAPGEKNHLAVHVEDHPVEYGSFSGDIPKGEYGAGHVDIWDHGEYEAEKWRDSEVIATLHGQPDGGLGGEPVKVALIRTAQGGDEKNWLIHRMELDAPRAKNTKNAKFAHSSGASGAKGEAGKGKPAASGGAKHPSRSSRSEYKPMLATLATERDVRDESDVAVEMKWDGVRVLAYVRGGETKLVSRNGIDITTTYPEFADLAGRLGGHDAVLDGEVIGVDKRGLPDFGMLQQRMRLTKPSDVAKAAKNVPVKYMLFDVLELDGEDVTGRDYDERRRMLEATVRSQGDVLVPPVWDGTLAEALERARELRLEGIMVKDRRAPYRVGRRSEAWLKIKLHRTQEVVVAGWRPGNGRRAGTVGSLLLGIPDRDGLHYVGRVGTGFDDRALDELSRLARRQERKTSPLVDVPRADARDAKWMSPTLVGEVEFAEWTRDGRLRQPSWRGLRPDKSPEEVVRES
ncbi:ATP-dependent DNA ligase [Gryllotalpicola ginsengisoli]|uniref:ATP-dependent DNA ligase n=1 Tax=Gryllotalpicola ginsengisoli TaxID=444608 RepID=UPI000484C298|nr:ATP-dependent DNA ligase [Gryllotalpicola ginsengisoli]